MLAVFPKSCDLRVRHFFFFFFSLFPRCTFYLSYSQFVHSCFFFLFFFHPLLFFLLQTFMDNSGTFSVRLIVFTHSSFFFFCRVCTTGVSPFKQQQQHTHTHTQHTHTQKKRTFSLLRTVVAKREKRLLSFLDGRRWRQAFTAEWFFFFSVVVIVNSMCFFHFHVFLSLSRCLILSLKKKKDEQCADIHSTHYFYIWRQKKKTVDFN